MKISQKLFNRAQLVIPGGVNSPVRAFKSVGGSPLFFKLGKGPQVWDADGNAYIDYVSSWGPLIAGHAHPEVVKAVKQAATRGLSFGAVTASGSAPESHHASCSVSAPVVSWHHAISSPEPLIMK